MIERPTQLLHRCNFSPERVEKPTDDANRQCLIPQEGKPSHIGSLS
jgi:hypothetical protein